MSEIVQGGWVLNNFPDNNSHEWACLAMKAFKTRYPKLLIGTKERLFLDYLDRNSSKWKTLLTASIEQTGQDGLRLIGLNNGYIDCALNLIKTPLLDCISNELSRGVKYLDNKGGGGNFFAIDNKGKVSKALEDLVKISIFLYEAKECYLKGMKVHGDTERKENSSKLSAPRMFQHIDECLFCSLYFFCLAKKFLFPDRGLFEVMDDFLQDKSQSNWLKEMYLKNGNFLMSSQKKIQESISAAGKISFYDLELAGGYNDLCMLAKKDWGSSAFEWEWVIEPKAIASEIEKASLEVAILEPGIEKKVVEQVCTRKPISL